MIIVTRRNELDALEQVKFAECHWFRVDNGHLYLFSVETDTPSHIPLERADVCFERWLLAEKADARLYRTRKEAKHVPKNTDKGRSKRSRKAVR